MNLIYKIIYIIFLFRTAILYLRKKNETARELILKYSYRYRNKGKHKYRNLAIVPPWAVFAYFNESYCIKESFSDIQKTYLFLLVNDLKNEPFRHASIALVLTYFFSIRDYNECKKIATQFLFFLDKQKYLYMDTDYQKSIMNIREILKSCEYAIENNYLNIPSNFFINLTEDVSGINYDIKYNTK